MAQYEEITIDKNSDASIQLELVDTNGNKKNLTNYSIKGKVKKNYADSAGEATVFTSTKKSPASDGVGTLTLTNTQTKALKAGRYVYDVVVTDSASERTKVLEGTVLVNIGITKIPRDTVYPPT